MQPPQRRRLLLILLGAILLGDLALYLWNSQAPPPSATNPAWPSQPPQATASPAQRRPNPRRWGGRFGDVPVEKVAASREIYFAGLRLLLDFQASHDKALLRQAAEKLKELEELPMTVFVRSGLVFSAWCREQLGDASQKETLISEGMFNATHYRFLFSKGLPDGAIRHQMALECQTGKEELQQALATFQAEHGGRLPTRLEDLKTESPLNFLMCPAGVGNSFVIDPQQGIECRNHPRGTPAGDQEEQSYKVHLMLLDGYTETERLNRVWSDLVAVSGLHEGQTVADVGCGPGLFTFPVAEKVGPKGKVYAVDINRSVLDFVAFAAAEKPGLKIQTFLASKKELTLPPESVEVITVIETYHSMVNISNPGDTTNLEGFLLPWLRTVRRALKPGGLLVIGDGNVNPKLIQQQVPLAGLELVPPPETPLRNEDYFSVFRRPRD